MSSDLRYTYIGIQNELVWALRYGMVTTVMYVCSTYEYVVDYDLPT